MSTIQATAAAEAAVPAPQSDASAPPDEPEAVGPLSTVTAATQEIRFGTAMTGGVSLAIWMGGVARELNLLDQASRMRELAGGEYRPPDLADEDERTRTMYCDLLEVLDQVIRIDVLSGTSAGGLNAAFLGLCHARGVDLGLLRSTWFDAGALDVLLRDPTEKAPPSLMQGDGVFLDRMIKAVEAMAMQPNSKPARDTTVYVTTTLLGGETSRFTDSYGTLVPDVDHLGIFTFSKTALTDDSPDARRALALAARSSASFPGAFEPAFVPFDAPAEASQKPRERPRMDRYANITRPHWVADGGILANRPIGPLLEAIFARPADDREVRRVLLYIVPDPGGTPNPRAVPAPERIDAPYSLAEALIHDLGAALTQSISTDLNEIKRHNDRVDSVRDTRVRLAELGSMIRRSAANGSPLPDFPTRDARADFAGRQAETIARPIVDRLMRAVTTFDGKVPAAWQKELAPGTSLEEECRSAVRRTVDVGWSRPPATGDYDALAGFGRSAFDGAKAIIISMLRKAFVLAADPAERTSLARFGKRMSAAFTPTGDFDIDDAIGTSVRGDSSADNAATRTLAMIASDIASRSTADAAAGYNMLLGPDLVRLDDDRLAAITPPTATTVLGRGWWIMSSVLDEAIAMMRQLVVHAADNASTDAAVGDDVSAAVGDDGSAVAPGAPATGADGPPAPARPIRLNRAQGRSLAAQHLNVYLDYLGRGSDQIAARLFDLHVAERSMLPIGMDVEQAVELIQVSANTRSLLDPERATAKDKLTGMQLNHFGAFYKRSWRANDWMWGRLDGAGWLVHALLDPRRILAVLDADPQTYPAGRRAVSFVDVLGRRFPGLWVLGRNPTDPSRVDVLAELKFLDEPDAPIPASIPTTALWLASAWQTEIVNAELPVVAREVLATPSRRDSSWAVGVVRRAGRDEEAVAAARHAVAAVSAGRSTRVARMMVDEAERRTDGRAVPGSARPAATTNGSDDRASGAEAARRSGSPTAPPPPSGGLKDRLALVDQLRLCPVPGETLAEERGEPLFARTLTQAAAVATAATTAISGTPASLKPALSAARTVTLTAYRAVDVTGAVPKRLLVAGLLATAVGIFLSVQHSDVLGLTGLVLLPTGLYLLAFGAWGWSRHALPALFAFTLVAALVAMCLPFVRHHLYGKDGAHRGWLSNTFEPWLRDSWWAIFVVIVGIVAFGALAGHVAGTPRRRARQRKQSRTRAAAH